MLHFLIAVVCLSALAAASRTLFGFLRLAKGDYPRPQPPATGVSDAAAFLLNLTTLATYIGVLCYLFPLA